MKQTNMVIVQCFTETILVDTFLLSLVCFRPLVMLGDLLVSRY